MGRQLLFHQAETFHWFATRFSFVAWNDDFFNELLLNHFTNSALEEPPIRLGRIGESLQEVKITISNISRITHKCYEHVVRGMHMILWGPEQSDDPSTDERKTWEVTCINRREVESFWIFNILVLFFEINLAVETCRLKIFRLRFFVSYGLPWRTSFEEVLVDAEMCAYTTASNFDSVYLLLYTILRMDI